MPGICRGKSVYCLPLTHTEISFHRSDTGAARCPPPQRRRHRSPDPEIPAATAREYPIRQYSLNRPELIFRRFDNVRAAKAVRKWRQHLQEKRTITPTILISGEEPSYKLKLSEQAVPKGTSRPDNSVCGSECRSLRKITSCAEHSCYNATWHSPRRPGTAPRPRPGMPFAAKCNAPPS